MDSSRARYLAAASLLTALACDCNGKPASEDAGIPPDAGSVIPDAGALAACTPGGDGGYINLAAAPSTFPASSYSALSAFCLVSIQDGGIAFDPSVIPYDLNTPLFSDYAVKVRGLWLPPGTQATYDPNLAFTFPLGTIFIKSFGFADDVRKANPVITWVETRLLINTTAGWEGYAYTWDAAGKVATILISGETVPLAWIGADGGTVSTEYAVPSFNQCKECHDLNNVVVPIGPKARQLNRIYAYPDGGENELAHWSRVGILAGAPGPSQAPVLPVWNDPDSGTVEQRARAYLEGNCAHCHNAGGYAQATGLWLFASETAPSHFGICKTPNAAGPGSCSLIYDIVPGDPPDSILMCRISSITPEIAMPQIERSVVDAEGVALVSQWIASMDGGCP
jgi:uncharacterized repeat protein (TIGR03806 family)